MTNALASTRRFMLTTALATAWSVSPALAQSEAPSDDQAMEMPAGETAPTPEMGANDASGPDDAAAMDDGATDSAAAGDAAADDASETESAGAADDASSDMSGTLERSTEDMARVIDALLSLEPKPIPELSAEEARQQPNPADAVLKVIEDQGIDVPEPAVEKRDITYPAGEGEQPARVYIPTDVGEGPFPLVVYVHGGGWVLATIDTYDASATAIADKLDAVVISLEYRHAPEHKFPAAHEDVLAGYKWAIENAGQFNADSERLAMVGESVGGNMVVATAIAARDQQLTEADHIVSVYPVSQTDTDTESYQENANAVPLSKAMMPWFFEKTVESEEQLANPRITLLDANLAALPPITIINATIDPLLDDGTMLADAIREAGGEVEQRTFEGVTHEFFGMSAVVEKAGEAQDYAVGRIEADLGE